MIHIISFCFVLASAIFHVAFVMAVAFVVCIISILI